MRYEHSIIETDMSLQTSKYVAVEKKIAASSMLHEANIAYFAFDVIVYCM